MVGGTTPYRSARSDSSNGARTRSSTTSRCARNPEKSSHRSGGTSSPPHRWSTDIVDGSIDSAFVERETADCLNPRSARLRRPDAPSAINAVCERLGRTTVTRRTQSTCADTPILHPEPQRLPRCGPSHLRGGRSGADDIVLDGRNGREVVARDRPPHQRGRDGGPGSPQTRAGGSPEEGHRVTQHARCNRSGAPIASPGIHA